MTFSGSAQEVAQPPRRVLVITLDGARPDALLQVATRIQAMAEGGASSWTAQTVFPPATLPAHASLLSGLDPSAHGYDDNVVRECGDFAFETFLSLAAEAGYRTAVVTGKAPLCQFVTREDTSFTLAREGDRSVVDGVIDAFEAGDEVILAHFPNPDYFGHLHGWMSETYLWELENTDYEIGRLLEEIVRLGLMDEMLIILTADHGGHDDEHGSDIPEDMTIPLIVTGSGVRISQTLGADAGLIDIAPTVLWALGIAIPTEMEGRVLCEAFVGTECRGLRTE